MRNDLLPFDNPLAKKNKSYKFQEVADVTFDDLSIYDTESNLPFRHKFRLVSIDYLPIFSILFKYC
jgi:hypothetical protein